MNVAFVTVLLFLIFVPGALFVRAYLSGPWSKKYIKTSAIDELAYAVVPGAVFQFIGTLLVETCTSYSVDFEKIAHLLLDLGDKSKAVEAFNSLHTYSAEIVWYNIVLWGVAFLLGLGARDAVKRLELDTKIPFLRFNNEWHYLLSGDILKCKDIVGEEGNLKDFDLTSIDAMVELGEETLIYSGILVNYELSRDGGLDRIYLENVFRRKLKDDKIKSEEREFEDIYYQMPGVFFVIPYSKIVNLNVDYFAYEKV